MVQLQIKVALIIVWIFFALAASMRENTQDAVKLFEKAFFEDKQTAIRILFWIRDIRGGQGEREIFRKCL